MNDNALIEALARAFYAFVGKDAFTDYQADDTTGIDGQIDLKAAMRAVLDAAILMNNNTKLWLWKNGDHYLAFDAEFPIYANGDPQVIGEPIGWAVFKQNNAPLPFRIPRDEGPPANIGDIATIIGIKDEPVEYQGPHLVQKTIESEFRPVGCEKCGSTNLWIGDPDEPPRTPREMTLGCMDCDWAVHWRQKPLGKGQR